MYKANMFAMRFLAALQSSTGRMDALLDTALAHMGETFWVRISWICARGPAS